MLVSHAHTQTTWLRSRTIDKGKDTKLFDSPNCMLHMNSQRCNSSALLYFFRWYIAVYGPREREGCLSEHPFHLADPLL